MSGLGKGWKLLSVVNDESEAYLLHGLLKGQGIDCRIQSMRVPQYPLTVDGLGEIHIVVKAEDFEESLRVMEAMTSRPVDQ